MLLLSRPFQSVVVQTALPDCYKFGLDSDQLLLQFLEILINRFGFLLVKRFPGPAWMHTNCNKTVLIRLAHLIGMNGILNVTCSNEQMTAPNIPGPLNDMRPIIWVVVLAVVLSTKLVVGEVGGDVVELVFRELLLHGKGEFRITYEGGKKAV